MHFICFAAGCWERTVKTKASETEATEYWATETDQWLQRKAENGCYDETVRDDKKVREIVVVSKERDRFKLVRVKQYLTLFKCFSMEVQTDPQRSMMSNLQQQYQQQQQQQKKNSAAQESEKLSK